MYVLHKLLGFFCSLNKNQLRDLSLLLSKVASLMPMMRHLSLLGNLACPHPIFSSSEENYARYLLLKLFTTRDMNKCKQSCR